MRFAIRNSVKKRRINRKAQFKLKLGNPSDRYEKEADRVANQIMSGPSGDIQSWKSQPGSLSAKYSEDSMQDLPGMSGKQMETGVQAFMESRFKRKFNQVKVHTGSRAEKLNRFIGAKAFTVGRNIVFGKNEYEPNSSAGRRLLAHELTHTIQQSGGSSQGVAKSDTIQRTIGDKRDLRSERFRGDPVLEACFDNEMALYYGARGVPIVKVQLALQDLGHTLPIWGADGIFGSETSRAVKSFQSANGLTPDAVIGFRTIDTLDLKFAQPIAQTICGSVVVPQPPGKSDAQMMSEGNGLALTMKSSAHTHLLAMRKRVFEGKMHQVPPNHQDWFTLRAAQTWLNINVGRRSEFLSTVDGAIQRVDDSLNLSVQLNARRGSQPKFNCVGCNQATAVVSDPAGVINHCDPFFNRGPLCRRDLNMHERFHLVGAPNHNTPATTPAGALNNVQNLVELVRDTNRQSNGHCAAGR